MCINCVANYKLLKSLPEDVNLYIEPISADDGVALGGVISSIINANETIPSFDEHTFGSQLDILIHYFRVNRKRIQLQKKLLLLYLKAIL